MLIHCKLVNSNVLIKLKIFQIWNNNLNVFTIFLLNAATIH